MENDKKIRRDSGINREQQVETEGYRERQRDINKGN